MPTLLEVDSAAVPDSSYYLAMAEGRWDQVAAPWGYRIGLPWMASQLSRWAHLSTPTSFLVLGIGSVGILVASMAFLLRGQLWILPLLLLSPVAGTLVYSYFLPDLMFSALVALFFVLLSVEWWWVAALLLFPMMLVRESTLVLTAIAVLVVPRSRWSAIAITATLAGFFVSHIAVPPLANVHGMGGLLYLVLKIPFNAMKNLAGIVVVPNTLRGQEGYTCPAAFSLSIHLGKIREVGVCRPDLSLPLTTLAIMLTTFGTGPLMLVTGIEAPAQTWMRIAVLYGLAAFLLAPITGAAIDRLASYGCPLCWLNLPRQRKSLSYWAVYPLVAWLPTAI